MEYFFKDPHTKKFWTLRVFFQEPQRIFNPIKVIFSWNDLKNIYILVGSLLLFYISLISQVFEQIWKSGKYKIRYLNPKRDILRKKNISGRNRSIFEGYISRTIRPANHEFEWLFSNKIMGTHLQQYFLGTSIIFFFKDPLDFFKGIFFVSILRPKNFGI